ncbi:MAG: right-handed parallel beta-helix repeat-containing protein, partial [Candidatus Hodarchaeales archaeon]
RGDCDGNNLTRNIITKNEGWGIEMYGDSNLNLIHNNSIIDNRDGGLFLDECPLNRIAGNKFEKNGIYIGGWLVSDYFQSEVANNTVNEKPLLFKQRETNIEFDSISYGQIILLECDEIIVKDQIILDTDCGILIRTCSNIEITNCTLQNIIHSGIHLANSNYVKISNCTLTNLNEGVTVSICVDIEIDNNTIKNCTYGIFLTGSNFSNITHNSLINNEQGLKLENSNINEIYANKILNNSESSLSLRYSLDNTISYNNITGGGTGISLYGSSSNRISNNNLISQGLSLEGWDRFHFVQADVSNNTVNGKPLIYWEDAVGDTIPEAGQIILIDCNDLQITDQNLSHASVGVFMYSCSNISIVNNQISHNNMYGIHGYSLIDGVIAFNNITVNGEGISVEDCNTINISNNFVINNSQRGILASFVQGPNLFLYDDHVYQLIRESMTWTEAQTFCEDIQGHLVTISSNEENLIVQSLIDGMTAWIGYTDEENEGTWAWITGESKNFSNWEVGEPNDAGGEDYAEIYEDGHWNDASGNYYQYFVCEWDYITLEYSSQNSLQINPVISNNRVENNQDGIILWRISEGKIFENTILNNTFSGLDIYDSNYCNISFNIINGNGMNFYQSILNIILNNTVISNGIHFEGNSIEQLLVENNTVNNKPLIYWKGIHDRTVPLDVSQIYLIDCERINITNLFISNTSQGIGIYRSNEINVQNVSLSNNSRTGINCIDSSNCYIKGNFIINNNEGIRLESSNGIGNNKIINNTISNISNDAIYLSSSPFSEISGNKINTNAHGIIVGYDTNYGILNSNVISSSQYRGLAIHGSYGWIMSNNIITNCSSSGLATWSGENLNIENNVFMNNSRGMELYDPFNFMIQGNSISNNDQQGLYISGGFGNIIHDNIFENNLDPCRIRWTEDCEFSENIISNNFGIGILIAYSSKISILKNTIVDNKINDQGDPLAILNNVGIGDRSIIMLEEVGDALIKENQVINNYGVGIVLGNSNYNEISENMLKNNSYAFYLDYDSGNNIVKNNDLINNIPSENLQTSANSQALDHGSSNIIVFNYWNEWVNPDNDGDEYVDIPYSLDGSQNSRDLAPLTYLNPPINRRILAPQVVYPTSGLYLRGAIMIQWLPALDSHDYRVSYSLFFSETDGKKWEQITEFPILNTAYMWDTRLHYDSSSCRLKIVTLASDGFFEEKVFSIIFAIDNGRIEPPSPLSLELRILLLIFLSFSIYQLLKYQKRK